jgi:hypothetical protein
MRTITLICALLLLASCGGSPEAQKRQEPTKKDDLHATSNADSSPIIISDGSIDMEHTNKNLDFHFHGQKHYSVKENKYQPHFLGFGCTADSQGHSDCTSDCDPNNILPKCKVDIRPNAAKAWALSLCEDLTDCTGRWTMQTTWQVIHPNNAEELDIVSHGQNLEVRAPSGKGKHLHHKSTNANHLQSASLTVTDTNNNSVGPYKFTCQQGQPCMTISYDCQSAGNCK